MVEMRKCACGCGVELTQRRGGRARIYATGACRIRAMRRRHALADIDGVAEFQPVADLVNAEPVVIAAGSTDDQVARSILEARSIGHAFQRLGTSARPEIAWRCSKVGESITSALAEFFPEVER